MEVFIHHIYEFQKGIRNLILHTTKEANKTKVIEKLEKRNISYRIYDLGNGHINTFFGAPECIAVIESVGKSNLSNYTAEEDFMLGIMLGYDRKKQCERYLTYKEKYKNRKS